MLLLAQPSGRPISWASKSNNQQGRSPVLSSIPVRTEAIVYSAAVCWNTWINLGIVAEEWAAPTLNPIVFAAIGIGVALGAGVCIGYPMIALLGTPKDIETFGGISGYFTPYGFVFGTLGAVTDGMEGFKFGSEVGAILSDLLDFREALGKFDFRAGEMGVYPTAYLLNSDVEDFRKSQLKESSQSDEDRDDSDDQRDSRSDDQDEAPPIPEITPPGSDGDRPSDEDEGPPGGFEDPYGDPRDDPDGD